MGNGLDGVLSDVPTTIGGPDPFDRNIISGNLGNGIDLGPLTTGSLVEGNFIGSDVSGTNPLGNAGDGVISNAPNNTIGGTIAGAGNTIVSNLGDGIAIDPSAQANVVQGNFIGTDITGTSALGNGGDGIGIENSVKNQIGGSNVLNWRRRDRHPSRKTRIAGNVGNGIEIDFPLARNNIVQGNRIGTDLTGTRSSLAQPS